MTDRSFSGQQLNVSDRTGGGAPDVTIVVVNFNGAGCLGRCLSALLAEKSPWSYEVLVVDNASVDGSPDIVREHSFQDGRVRLERSPENLGYAGAVNLALQKIDSRYLAVLNMDLVVQPGWLQPLIDFLEQSPRVAAVNPMILLMDGEHINAAGQHVHVPGLCFNSALGSDIMELDSYTLQVSGLHGGAFVIRTDLLRSLGGMDEAGFLYHEDVNLSWLLHICDYDLYCIPSSQVLHDYFLTMYPEKFHLLERNRIMMLLCYLQKMTFFWLSPLLLCTELMTWGYALLRGRRFLNAKCTSYYWVWKKWSHILRRRIWVCKKRRLTDRQLFKHLHYQYVWRQCFSLGKERKPSLRMPHGGLVTNRKRSPE
jgi:GT2 family glycosyltransferase